MIPMFLLGLVGGRKWIAWIIVSMIVASVVGGIAWAGWTVKGWAEDSEELAIVKPKMEALEAAQKTANEKVIKQAPVDEKDRRELAETKAALEAARIERSRAWSRVAALQETLDEKTGCPVVRLSDDWGLQFVAAVTGDSTDPQ